MAIQAAVKNKPDSAKCAKQNISLISRRSRGPANSATLGGKSQNTLITRYDAANCPTRGLGLGKKALRLVTKIAQVIIATNPATRCSHAGAFASQECTLLRTML
jgi:hypothetical protein